MKDDIKYLTVLTGEQDPEITAQTIPVSGGTPQILHGKYSDLATTLKHANDAGQGVFVTVNETDGKGRKTANITKVRAVFIDLDGAPIGPILVSPLKPQLIIESSEGKWHAYWLVSDCPLNQFKVLQQALAKKYDGDPAVCDLPRVMRLPGLNHQKEANKFTGELTEPFLTHIAQINNLPPYSVQEIIKGIELNTPTATMENSPKNRFDINDKLIDGQRTRALTQYCGKLIQLSCSTTTALEMLGMWNNTSCEPPLPKDKIVSTFESIKRTDERNQSEVHPAIAELNKDHAVVSLSGKTVVLHEYPKGEIEYRSVTDFNNYFANKRVEGKSLGQFWMTHPHRRTYMGVIFDPSTKAANDNFYNLWKGFAVDPIEADCSLYLTHLKENICSGNDKHYQYFLDWMAHAVQYPDKLPGVAIVLKGEQGTGKGVLVSNFGKIFGRHFKHLTSKEHFLGRFNGHMQDTMLAFADEVMWGGNKQEEGILKTLITESRRQFEHKNKGVVELDNYCRVVMATNKEWAVPAGLEERRFFVLEVSNNKQQDIEYFTAIQKQMDNGGRQALLFSLLNRDIANVEIRAFPKTAALAEQKLLSLDTVSKWWYGCLLEGSIGPCNKDGDLMPSNTFNAAGSAAWPEFTSTSNLYDYYIEHAAKLGERYKSDKGRFGKAIKKLTKAEVIRLRKGQNDNGDNRVRGYTLPPLEQARGYFEETMGQALEWDDAGD